MPLLTRFQLIDTPTPDSERPTPRPPDTEISSALSTALIETVLPASTVDPLMCASTVLTIALMADEPATADFCDPAAPTATDTMVARSVAETVVLPVVRRVEFSIAAPTVSPTALRPMAMP